MKLCNKSNVPHGTIFNFIKVFKHTHWHFLRNIRGSYFRDNIAYDLTGQATFYHRADVGNALLYQEEGIINLARKPQPFYQKYLFSCDDQLDSVSVFFVDRCASVLRTNRLFHRVYFKRNLSSMAVTGRAEHHCGEDGYNTAYEICFSASSTSGAITRFSIFHEVSGPKKKYCSKTFFTRCSAQSSNFAAHFDL